MSKNRGRAARNRHLRRGKTTRRVSGNKRSGIGERQNGKNDQQLRPSSNLQSDTTAAGPTNNSADPETPIKTGPAWPIKNGFLPRSKREVVVEVDLPQITSVAQSNYDDDQYDNDKASVVAIIVDASGRVRLFLKRSDVTRTPTTTEEKPYDIGAKSAMERAGDNLNTTVIYAENSSTISAPSHVLTTVNKLAEYIEPKINPYCSTTTMTEEVPRAKLVNERQKNNDMVTAHTSLSTTSVSAYEYVAHNILFFKRGFSKKKSEAIVRTTFVPKTLKN